MNQFQKNGHPLYQRSLAVSSVGQAIAAYFSYDQNVSKKRRFSGLRAEIADAILTDTKLISITLNDALKKDSKEQFLKDISFVNIMLKNVLSYCNGLERDGVKEREYVNLLRAEIKAFRKSFKTWRKNIY